jgi:hypothetical protein
VNIREYLNNNSAVATIVAVVVLVLALGIIVWTSRGPSTGPIETYYFDMNTQRLVTATGEPTPFDTGSGDFNYPAEGAGMHPAGVNAQIFSCTESCDNVEAGMTADEVKAAGAFIGYLQRQSPEAAEVQKKYESGGQLTPDEEEIMYTMGQLVAAPDGGQWVPAESEEGFRLTDVYSSNCADGQKLTPCYP